MRVTVTLMGRCRRCGWECHGHNDEQIHDYARFHEIDDHNTTCVARASEIDTIIVTECVPQMPVSYDGAHDWIDATLVKINRALVMSHQIPPHRLGRV